VEDENFKRYVLSLNPNAVLPTRKTLTGLIYDSSDKLLMMIRESLGLCRSLCITTDIWSNNLMTNSFLGVTCHYFNYGIKKRQNFRIGELS